MMGEEWAKEFCDQNPSAHEQEHEDEHQDSSGTDQHDFSFNFDLLSLVSKAKDYYRILEVDFDAPEEVIRSNYIRLALKWHPDKRKDQDSSTSKFQEINEAYQDKYWLLDEVSSTPSFATFYCIYCTDEGDRDLYVLSDPIKRQEYDSKGMFYVTDYNFMEYLNRFKGLILTCNGLGMRQ